MTERMTCDERAHRCLCALWTDHNGPHECYCGSRWQGNHGERNFEVILWPQRLMENGERTSFADDPSRDPALWIDRSMY